MRIIGEFDIDGIKATVLFMNEKYSVKYEYNLLEQTYKFRDGSGIKNVEDVIRFSTSDRMNEVKKIFDQMAILRMQGLQELYKSELEDFEEIL